MWRTTAYDAAHTLYTKLSCSSMDRYAVRQEAQVSKRIRIFLDGVTAEAVLFEDRAPQTTAAFAAVAHALSSKGHVG